ncbi:hypothetical protein LGT39_12500 [Demequina sp. TTPB684]|uniref:hypothetical protein n=1 Tax=unclassified Demequina TaxID=2620311 RepID=UPI001CF3F7E9|nr:MULTISPECIES: hypothetical protein [unclassified Demequina]MCB2413665.1 hypothetical protein [Demequina sp. TTPB684]UPU87727.1 hypothetical protein LGT36_010755 [Demequina sp. TMPB413]
MTDHAALPEGIPNTKTDTKSLIGFYEPRPPRVKAVMYDGSDASLRAVVQMLTDAGVGIHHNLSTGDVVIDRHRSPVRGGDENYVVLRTGNYVVCDYDWGSMGSNVDLVPAEEFKRRFMLAHS